MPELEHQPQFQTSIDVKLDYIQRDIGKIELNIQKIQSDNIGRREFTETTREFGETIKQIRTEMIPIQDYKTDKARVWIAIAILLALGGTIITLSIMAINSKIKTGIDEAFSNYIIKTEK